MLNCAGETASRYSSRRLCRRLYPIEDLRSLNQSDLGPHHLRLVLRSEQAFRLLLITSRRQVFARPIDRVPVTQYS